MNFNLLMVGILSYIWWLILMMLLIVFAAVLSLNEESTGIKGLWVLWILSSTFVLFVDFKFFIPTIRKKVVLEYGGLRPSPFPGNQFKNLIYYSLLGKYYITCIYWSFNSAILNFAFFKLNCSIDNQLWNYSQWRLVYERVQLHGLTDRSQVSAKSPKLSLLVGVFFRISALKYCKSSLILT